MTKYGLSFTCGQRLYEPDVLLSTFVLMLWLYSLHYMSTFTLCFGYLILGCLFFSFKFFSCSNFYFCLQSQVFSKDVQKGIVVLMAARASILDDGASIVSMLANSIEVVDCINSKCEVGEG